MTESGSKILSGFQATLSRCLAEIGTTVTSAPSTRHRPKTHADLHALFAAAGLEEYTDTVWQNVLAVGNLPEDKRLISLGVKSKLRRRRIQIALDYDPDYGPQTKAIVPWAKVCLARYWG